MDQQKRESENTPLPYEVNPPKRSGGSRFGQGFAVGIIVAVAAVLAVGLCMRSPGSILDRQTRDKVNVLSRYIQKMYYEDVDGEVLQEGVYKGLFEGLDPYSEYYSSKEYQQIYEDSLSGQYGGIGAGLQQDGETGQAKVIRVYDGSPAQECGLKEGDIILSADGYQIGDGDLTEFVSHIRGEEGTVVHLEISREGGEMGLDIERRNLEVPTVSGEMLDSQTGYIMVTEFTGTTAGQFSEMLEQLKGQGMTRLIIDLRDNPGGILSVVCEMLDEILPEGLAVYTENKNGERRDYCTTDDKALDIPLAVLVNGQSASGSEVFCGAIRDRNAGVIIGTTTYGKGVVQTFVEMKDGSAFKITTDRYFTPDGTCIHEVGIVPDVEIPFEFLGEEDEEYSYDKDNQIQRALEVLAGEQSE